MSGSTRWQIAAVAADTNASVSSSGVHSVSSSSGASSSLLPRALLYLLLAAALAVLGSLICTATEPPCHRSNGMLRSLHLALNYVNGPPPTWRPDWWRLIEMRFSVQTQLQQPEDSHKSVIPASRITKMAVLLCFCPIIGIHFHSNILFKLFSQRKNVSTLSKNGWASRRRSADGNHPIFTCHEGKNVS